jgi:hypothetical protein
VTRAWESCSHLPLRALWRWRPLRWRCSRSSPSRVRCPHDPSWRVRVLCASPPPALSNRLLRLFSFLPAGICKGYHLASAIEDPWAWDSKWAPVLTAGEAIGVDFVRGLQLGKAHGQDLPRTPCASSFHGLSCAVADPSSCVLTLLRCCLSVHSFIAAWPPRAQSGRKTQRRPHHNPARCRAPREHCYDGGSVRQFNHR